MGKLILYKLNKPKMNKLLATILISTLLSLHQRMLMGGAVPSPLTPEVRLKAAGLLNAAIGDKLTSKSQKPELVYYALLGQQNYGMPGHPAQPDMQPQGGKVIEFKVVPYKDPISKYPGYSEALWIDVEANMELVKKATQDFRWAIISVEKGSL